MNSTTRPSPFPILSTEEGMLSLLASLNPLGRAGVTADFTQDMARGVFGRGQEARRRVGQPGTIDKARRLTQVAAQMGFAGMLGKAALGEGVAGERREIPERAKPFQGPLVTVKCLNSSRSATGTATSAWRLSPEAAAVQAEQMQREALGGQGVTPEPPPRPVVPSNPPRVPPCLHPSRRR